MKHKTTTGMRVERYTGTGQTPYMYSPPLATEVLDVLCFCTDLEFLYDVEKATVRSVWS